MTAERRVSGVRRWDIGDTIPADIAQVDDVGGIRWFRLPGGVWRDEPGFDVLTEDVLLRTYGPVTSA